ncbi:MAG: hypothetical protein JNL08_08130 [Planctomycetes bacterium]|nr:hypothetical protein [Planctomycetota bacterium]
MHRLIALSVVSWSLLVAQTEPPAAVTVAPTREFEVRGERAFLGGQEVDLWGLRCGNALYSRTVTERHVRALDTMVAHGINAIAVYLQGSHGGWPDPDAGLNGFRRDGTLKRDVAERLEWLIRECDQRGMVVCVGVFSPRKDQVLEGDAAVRRAVEQTAQFLQSRGLRNVFVDLAHEFDHTDRADQPLLREPDGAAKKAQLTRWFHDASAGIEVGVCPYEKSTTTDSYPGMDVRIVQKSMAIPPDGFVVNVETQKRDAYENDGVFTPGQFDAMRADWERYRAAPNAVMFFHAAFVQGIGNFSGTAPHPEIGGAGDTAGNRGVRCYYEWVRDTIGRWRYPRHEPVATTDGAAAAASAPTPTREFEVRGERAFLGGEEVRLWGLRCNNALLSPAVTQRFVANLDNMAAHGINLISVALQGTNGGFPDVDAGPNAFTGDGMLIPAFARRLELVVREADRRGMVVLVVLMMPRKDQLLRDEAAVRRAIEQTAALLQTRGLRNVIVNLFQEFHHPTRIDHEVFREPDGAAKKARLTGWFHAVAPDIEVGIVPNHLNGSPVDYPGADVMMIHEAMPLPDHGFVVNTETPDEDASGNEGLFTAQSLTRLDALWRAALAEPRLAILFRTTYVEDVRGVMGTGPNAEMGGSGASDSDRGIRFFYEWSRSNLGVWRYPRHER